MEQYIFYLLATLMIVFAVLSVNSKRMLRSVVYLLFVLLAIARFYFLIDYNFLAAVQLTVYAGGIVILIIFSVFLVHHIEMQLELAPLWKRLLTGVLCLIGIGVFLTVLYQFDFVETSVSTTTEIAEIGAGLLNYGEGGYILPFEVISVLLLAAMVAAIVIARPRKSMSNTNAKS